MNSSIMRAKEAINRAIQTTIQRLFEETRPRSPSDLLALFRFPNKQAIEIARAAQVRDVTSGCLGWSPRLPFKPGEPQSLDELLLKTHFHSGKFSAE